MPKMPSRLLVVAHGTASSAGTAVTAELVDAIAAARPGVSVSLSFLDVAHPRLPEALGDLTGAIVVLPLLLSTGYHVQSDIPAAVAGRPDVQVARHLGPHPLVTEALADRLPREPTGGDVALVGTGSSRPEAAAELAAAGALLAERLGVPVATLTMADDVRGRLAALPAPVRVASYLLAPGRFHDLLLEAADGIAPVAAPIGVHPAVVRLVWARYDEVVGPGPQQA